MTFSQCLVLQLYEQWDGVLELLHPEVEQSARAKLTDNLWQLLELFDERFHSFQQHLRVQICPQSLSPHFSCCLMEESRELFHSRQEWRSVRSSFDAAMSTN